jgi:hypothetical protein
MFNKNLITLLVGIVAGFSINSVVNYFLFNTSKNVSTKDSVTQVDTSATKDPVQEVDTSTTKNSD